MNRISRRSLVKLAGAGTVAAAVGDGLISTSTASAHGVLSETLYSPAQQMALDPQMQAVITELMSLQAPKITDMDAPTSRQTAPLMNAVLAVATRQGKPCVEGVANVAHFLIPGGAKQQMMVRVYQPAGEGPFPALVYFHGGGWVFANLDTYDSSCRALTNAANCAVISVAYRQAPENKFPAAPEDAFAAYQWVLANGPALRIDPAKVAVGGESAGGNLATVTAMIARDRGAKVPVHQMLIYPVTRTDINLAGNYPSYAENMMAMPLATPALPWFYRYYLRTPADANNPYASPLKATNLKGLPSATVITAEFDPLRDEGEAYAQKLKEAGIAATLTRYTGVTHEFFSMAGIVDKAKQAVAEAAAGLKTAFGA